MHYGRASLPSSIAVAFCLMATALPALQSQQPRPHVDTVLVARDLDGDGNTDYIVRESRVSRGGPRSRRLAIYLGVQPTVARAMWATDWDDEFGAQVDVGELLPLGTSS